MKQVAAPRHGPLAGTVAVLRPELNKDLSRSAQDDRTPPDGAFVATSQVPRIRYGASTRAPDSHVIHPTARTYTTKSA